METISNDGSGDGDQDSLVGFSEQSIVKRRRWIVHIVQRLCRVQVLGVYW